MKLPLSWLKEYIDFEDDIEGLSKKLTFSGLEVEGIETIGAGIDDVIVGEVRTVEKHPDADKLSLCTVFDGTEDVAVVCGAPNVRPGMKSAFAPVGAVLPGNFKIRKAKIRGVKSFGMLCAEDELGLGSGHDGIMDLPEDTPAGTPLSELAGPPDVVFDLEVTPNRPDCLCALGIARDLAALYDTRVKYPDCTIEESGHPANQQTSVDIEDPEGCPRYTARILHDVRIGPSPEWMQRRLALAGIRPINNAVDITNYVMLEYGQPQHAFDFTQLNEGRIVVRKAREGEVLQTLDGSDRALKAHHLVIADAEKPVALAGVMGGANSEINETTQTVLLESAQFNSKVVRHAAKELEVSSESSYRFARGVDIGGVDRASQRAAHLFQQLAGASISTGVVDTYPAPVEPWTLSCRWQRINSMVGIEIPHEVVRKLLEGIELEWVEEDNEKFVLRIPTFRGDLTREADLIEEVSRLYGLDNIPAPSPRAEIVPGADDSPSMNRRRLRNHLLGLGLTEIVNYSLTSEKSLNDLDPEHTDRRVVLPHPISQDQSVLRTSLLPHLVETLARNKAHQNHEAALFEIGRTYLKQESGVEEKLNISAGIMGPVGRGPLDKRRPLDEVEAYATIKGLVEALAQAVGLGPLLFSPCPDLLFAPGRAAVVECDGKVIGRIGLLSDTLAKANRMSDPVALAEIETTPLFASMQQRTSLKPPPAFPGSTRDAALLVRRDTTHAQVEATIRKYASPELEEIKLFDVFISDRVDAARKSMAYSCLFRSAERTLTDDEVAGYHHAILEGLKKDLSAEVRDS